ncbi:unnamed protein product [Adineta ricciae]|uniref:Uncharacterized protein n=1 Tax=Adineta ricciae TaxID=249248 RepID=A0A814CR79_ADIRI|nr:unnamed protein product [Adineta ricciae]
MICSPTQYLHTVTPGTRSINKGFSVDDQVIRAVYFSTSPVNTYLYSVDSIYALRPTDPCREHHINY